LGWKRVDVVGRRRTLARTDTGPRVRRLVRATRGAPSVNVPSVEVRVRTPCGEGVLPTHYVRPVSALRLVSAVALVVGVGLLAADLVTPQCRNYAGTARDSGYPCTVDRSGGSTDLVLSRTSTVSLPLATPLVFGLIALGAVGVARSRRR
jgi:hypothetical protein